MRVHDFAKANNISLDDVKSSLMNLNGKIPHHLEKLSKEEIDYLLEINRERIDSYINYSSLKQVKIWGLFGSHNFDYKFEKSINIFIAENGFGKTTVLNIIVAALKNDSSKLMSLPFNKVELFFNKGSYEFENPSSNNIPITDYNFNEFKSFITTVRRYLPREYANEINGYLKSQSFDYDFFKKIIDSELDHVSLMVKRRLLNSMENVIVTSFYKSKSKEIQEDVLYYPTYRRVETDFKEILGRDIDVREREELNEMELLTEIQFGLSDVEEMLKEITDKLKGDAITLYSKMNGEILDALLRNEINKSSKAKKAIDIANLKTIIGRIGESKIKENKKLYEFVENGIDSNSNKELTETQVFLNYYLNKLLEIYELQLPLEKMILNFVNVCNKYLVNKSFVYDSVATSVRVEKTDKQEINLSMLSSGEKQLISILARLYLRPKKPVIFVIDEPELSLSITWQKEFLVDLYKSENIALLISATHSPFIFDNVFDEYALEMNFS